MIDALAASGKYHKIVIVVPTIALIDETRRRLLNRFREKCAIITHPTQEAVSDRINIYTLTQERVLQREDLDDVDLLIIDEFYKMNLDAEDSSDRAVDLNLAFHKIAQTGAQFYLLGPNIHEISGLEKYQYHFIPSEFSTVAVDVINLDLPSKGDHRDEKLIELCSSIDGPTIVYCQSPRKATDVARLLAERANLPIIETTSSAVSWISANFHPDWSVCTALQHGIGVHHGGIPRALQQYFIRLFNARKIPLLVCTSTIIEGVNTVAKNVIIYDRRKSRSVLDHFTYKNIEGRAGRMGQYFVGRVYVLETAPQDEGYSVELPIEHQRPDTPLSLLLKLDNEDLTPLSQERLKALFQQSSLAPDTLRHNRYTPPNIQEQIAAAIRADLVQYEDALRWSGVPRGHQLQAVCELIFDYIEGNLLRDYGVFSGKSLAWHLNVLRQEQDLSKYIRTCVSQRFADQSPSEVVETCLRFIRNVVCQHFPRDLMVIDAIQRDIFSRSDIKSGDYSTFAEQAENLFMPSILFALDEYGVPLQTVQRISPWLTPADTLNEVIDRLANTPLDLPSLVPFEREILDDIRQTVLPQLPPYTP